MYRPTKNELLSFFLARNRARLTRRAIRRDDIRTLITALKGNEIVWYAPDQSYRKKGAEMVRLFGSRRPRTLRRRRLAGMTGAAILPYFVERLPGRRGYRAVIQPALENFPSGSPVADAERFNHLIEQHVRAVPEQYLLDPQALQRPDGRLSRLLRKASAGESVIEGRGPGEKTFPSTSMFSSSAAVSTEPVSLATPPVAPSGCCSASRTISLPTRHPPARSSSTADCVISKDFTFGLVQGAPGARGSARVCAPHHVAAAIRHAARCPSAAAMDDPHRAVPLRQSREARSPRRLRVAESAQASGGHAARSPLLTRIHLLLMAGPTMRDSSCSTRATLRIAAPSFSRAPGARDRAGHPSGWRATLKGAHERVITARAVVNATGPWVTRSSRRPRQQRLNEACDS